MAHDVFICHSSEDKASADKVCEALEAEGIKCWIAPRDVIPGMVWAASINSAIKNSRLIVLIHSRHANESKHVLREIELASKNNIPILPLRLENINSTYAIEYYIGADHWLDAYSPAQIEKHLGKLTKAAKQHLGISLETFKDQPKRELQLAAKDPERGTKYKVGKLFQDKLKSGELGPKMVVLPSGSFMMSSTKETDGYERYDDEHQHPVTIEKPFAMGQYPVTNAQYRQFKPEHDSGSYKEHSLNGDDQPVVEVSWHDAVAYTRWLSEQTGKTYRLPTEAEWEYAARAGTKTRRFWGDDANQACEYANVHDRKSKHVFNFDWSHHHCDDGHAVTSPVGRFKPNGFKLYDMLGNVWEWTCSEYDDSYAGAEKRCQSEGDASRSLRGGSGDNEPRNVRSASRYRFWPSLRNDSFGFRLAQDL